MYLFRKYGGLRRLSNFRFPDQFEIPIARNIFIFEGHGVSSFLVLSGGDLVIGGCQSGEGKPGQQIYLYIDGINHPLVGVLDPWGNP